jgi:hypothetical protein
MNPLRRLWHRFRARRPGQPPTHGNISFDADQIETSWCTLEGQVGASRLRWADVHSVVAFKRDLYIVDLMCLAFNSGSAGALEVHEEMRGWQDLVDALPDHLPGSTPFPDWWAVVAFPAFAANPTTIFSRAAA